MHRTQDTPDSIAFPQLVSENRTLGPADTRQRSSLAARIALLAGLLSLAGASASGQTGVAPAAAVSGLGAAGVATAAAAPSAVVAATLPGDSEESVLIQLLRAEAAAYEHGDGVERDGVRAAAVYCKAARLGDAKSQFDLGWLYTNGRGVERSESTAAFFFHAAAEQGHEQAQHMLSTVGGPSADVPTCMRPPTPPSATVRVARALPVAPPGRGASAPFVPAVEVNTRAPKYILDLVKQLAPEYRIEPQLVLSIIETESNFDTVALSPKNARGLMQLIPETAARFNVRNAFDPTQNIRGGMAYLRWLLAYFEGDVSLVAAAYNAGEGAVDRYRGVPPYLETLTYVRKVLTSARMVDHAFDATVTEPSPRFRQARTR